MDKIVKAITEWQFNLIISLLGIMFLILALGSSILVYKLAITSPYIIFMLALMNGIPIYLTFLFIGNRHKQYGDDEYLRLMLTKHTLTTSLWSMGIMAIMGFIYANIPNFDASQLYILFVGIWYGMWLVTSVFNKVIK